MKLALDLGLPLGGAGGATALPLLGLAPHLYMVPLPAYLYQDEAHTTLVTASGQGVGAAVNHGLDGGYMTQGTAANEPAYTAGGGLHFLLGDGSNDYLDAAFVVTGVDLYIAAAFMPLATAAFDHLISVSDIGQNDYDAVDNSGAVTRNNADAQFGAICDSAFRGVGSITDGTAYVVESIFTSGSHTFSVNGSDNTAASTHNFNAAVLRLLAGITSGGPLQWLNGRCYGLFARRGTVPTSGQRATIRTSLGALAGLTL